MDVDWRHEINLKVMLSSVYWNPATACCEFIWKQESRAAARKPHDAASVLFRWSSPTTFTTSI